MITALFFVVALGQSQQVNCRSYYVGNILYTSCDGQPPRPATPPARIDPTIPMQVETPKIDNPLDVMLKAEQLRALRQQNNANAAAPSAKPPTAEATTRRDGNLWRKTPEGTRAAIAAGVLIGVSEVSWVLLGNDKRIPGEEVGHALGAILDATDGITGSQLADGMTAFYDDARNRHIRIDLAAVAVLSSMKGMPQQDYEAMVERFRSVK